jgi:hypothetical protein
MVRRGDSAPRAGIRHLSLKKLVGLLGLVCLLPAGALASQAQETSAATSLEPIVLAHYASWYMGLEGGWYNKVGGKTIRPAYTPRLGYYDVRRPATLSQHVAWAKAYGIDAFMVTWDGNPTKTFPLSNEHTVTLFIENPNFLKIKFFFVYGVNTSLRKKDEVIDSPVDLNDSTRVNKFIADMKFAASKYFNQPNYLKIQGKPVLYVWATGWLRGDLKKALARIRASVKSQCGINLYIIADEVGWGATAVYSRTRAWDAVMPYMMLKPQEPVRNYKLESSIAEIASQYRNWKNICSDLGIGFVPGVFPGENARGAPWLYGDDGKLTVPVVYRSPAAFEKFILETKPLTDAKLRLFYITSWNEWNEGTNIEPSTQFQFDYLNVVRKALKTFVPSESSKDILKFSFQRVWNPGEGNRVLAAAFDWVEFLSASGEVLLKFDIGTAAVRAYLGMGWSGDEQGMGDADTFVWAVDSQKYATIHFALPAGTTMIRFKAFQVDPPQYIKVSLNGRYLGVFPVQTPFEWDIHEVTVPSL